jgi:uroporphyrin-III C-methyltransferase
MVHLEFPHMPEFMPGSVWLAGAGPGDPGLLTLLTLHGLNCADVVVYDALVDARTLDLSRSGAKQIFAGKRGGRPSVKQPDISDQLVQLARAGNRVLRLKGGDPFVFGRGGEEALALVEAGIPFRIIPGITAGIGGLAYAGIPVTHRDTNSAVTFVTGHSATGPIPENLDWQAIAAGAPVLVFYMALKQLPKISHCLIDAGRSCDEPVAIVSRAATPEQVVVESTLSTCGKTADTATTPAIIVVGPVVRLRSVLDWFDVANTKLGVAEQMPPFRKDDMLLRD